MSFVIYNLKSFKLLECRQANKRSYETMSAAKAAITRVATAAENCRIVTRLANFKAEEWAIADTDEFYKSIKPATKMITVTNLMSGKQIQIAEDTPRCCDPSSELYWSM